MNNSIVFLDRLRYGKHIFMNGAEEYASPHTNPDGSTGGWVAESAYVDNTCYVSPNAEILEYAQVLNNSKIDGYACVRGFAVVKDYAKITDHSIVTDGALIEGDVLITGITCIGGRSHINWGVVDNDAINDYLIQLKGQKIEVNPYVKHNNIK